MWRVEVTPPPLPVMLTLPQTASIEVSARSKREAERKALAKYATEYGLEGYVVDSCRL